MKKRETRHNVRPLSIRKAEGQDDSRRIEGYALVFNSRSVDLGGFTEVIAPGALEGVLAKSDVLALYNHDINRGLLARSRQGEGTLELTIDDTGLRYSFEAPNTALGDELLEGVRRGDIAGSSFAFTVDKDHWEEDKDGSIVRTIIALDELFDVSPVIHPAYEETSVDSRGLDALRAKCEKEEKSEDEEEKDPENEDENGDTAADGGPSADSEPENDPDTDEPEGSDNPDDSDSTDEEETDKDNNNNNRNVTPKKMKKQKFSLMRAINALVDKRQFDEVTEQLVERGRRAADQAGVSATGDLVLALEDAPEHRDAPNGIVGSQGGDNEGYGGEAVPTDTFDILGPLRDRLVVTQLGARMLNLSGNVEVPVYSGATCTWENETAPAKKAIGEKPFRKVKLTPKRLTAKLPITKQFLIQTSPSAEALLRQDLINCIADKLQSTIFGNAAGTDTMPAGMLNGVSAEAADVTFANVVNWEADLETAKVLGEKKYVLSPAAKATLRTTPVDAGSGFMVMQNNEVAGIQALSTGSVAPKGLILGDWSNLYVATFGAIDLTVDPYTLASEGQIQLVINAYFDYAVVRPEAFVKKILK